MEKQSKVRKINKRAKEMAKKLEGIIFLKKDMSIINLTEEEIYILLTENKIIVKEGEFRCRIE